MLTNWFSFSLFPPFLSATTYSFCFPSGIKGRGKEKEDEKGSLGTGKLRSCQKVHSRESELPCIQSLKLSVFKGGAVTGPLHGEITCCSPSLKMLTLSY